MNSESEIQRKKFNLFMEMSINIDLMTEPSEIDLYKALYDFPFTPGPKGRIKDLMERGIPDKLNFMMDNCHINHEDNKVSNNRTLLLILSDRLISYLGDLSSCYVNS